MTATQVGLQVDAKNRATRAFVQGLAIDVLVALAVVVWTYLNSVDGWGAIQWSVLAFTLFKTLCQTAASYLMRRFLDNSKVPTPLPPAPAVQPADTHSIPDAVRQDEAEYPPYVGEHREPGE